MYTSEASILTINLCGALLYMNLVLHEHNKQIEICMSFKSILVPKNTGSPPSFEDNFFFFQTQESMSTSLAPRKYETLNSKCKLVKILCTYFNNTLYSKTASQIFFTHHMQALKSSLVMLTTLEQKLVLN